MSSAMNGMLISPNGKWSLRLSGPEANAGSDSAVVATLESSNSKGVASRLRQNQLLLFNLIPLS